MPDPTSGTWTYDRANHRVMSDALAVNRLTGARDVPTPVCDLSGAFKTLEEMHQNGLLLAASKRLLAFVVNPDDLLALIEGEAEGLIAAAKGTTP